MQHISLGDLSDRGEPWGQGNVFDWLLSRSGFSEPPHLSKEGNPAGPLSSESTNFCVKQQKLHMIIMTFIFILYLKGNMLASTCYVTEWWYYSKILQIFFLGTKAKFVICSFLAFEVLPLDVILGLKLCSNP